MAGLTLTQDNTTIEVDLDDTNGYVEWPGATSFNKGEKTFNRENTSTFSTAAGEADYSNGAPEISEGSIVYNANIANAVHKYMLENEGSQKAIKIRVTIVDPSIGANGHTYTVESDFLLGAVNETIEYGSTYTHEVAVQRTGVTTRTDAAVV